MNQAVPNVSVIMPCYNQGHYLNAAVESVLHQTYQNFEIIIINDGSTDLESIQILKNFQSPKTVILHTNNQGPSAARNVGIRHAQGKFILPLDADDRIEKTYLEKAVWLLEEQPDLGIVYCQAEFFGAKTGKCDLPGYNFPGILLGNMIFNSSLYRRSDWEAVGGYNENMIHGWEDYDFWLSIIELGRRVVQIPEALYFYRQVPQSRSTQMTQEHVIACYVQIYRNHPKLYTAQIETIFRHIVDLRQDVHQTHARLHDREVELNQCQAKLDYCQLKLDHCYQELSQSQAKFTWVQTSKFWWLRTQWLKFKALLRFKVKE